MKKIAVLVVIKSDGTTTTKVGEKGPIYTETRELIRSINLGPAHDVARVVALGESGVLKSYKWKTNAPAVSAPDQDPTEEASGPDDGDSPADVQALREALKAKGVKVPPRISADNLLALAIEHGVDA